MLFALNRLFKEGIPLPLGADLDISPAFGEIRIYKDYLLAEIKPNKHLDEMRSWRFYSAYDHQKEGHRAKNFPITWVVDQNNQVTYINANGDETDKSDTSQQVAAAGASAAKDSKQQCKGKDCAAKEKTTTKDSGKGDAKTKKNKDSNKIEEL